MARIRRASDWARVSAVSSTVAAVQASGATDAGLPSASTFSCLLYTSPSPRDRS